MATPFEIALQNFARYADSVHPNFGAGVRDIIVAEWASKTGRGFGDASSDTIENIVLSQHPTLSSSPTPEVSTVQRLSSFVDSVASTYLKAANTYYTTQGKIADLKVQAQGNPLTQAQNALSPTPVSWILWAGVGLGAILLLRPSSPPSGGRR